MRVCRIANYVQFNNDCIHSTEIIVPGFWSRETSLLGLVAGMLIARTISDIYLIQAVTEVEAAIVSMNRGEFKSSILKYAAPLPLVSTIVRTVGIVTVC